MRMKGPEEESKSIHWIWPVDEADVCSLASEFQYHDASLSTMHCKAWTRKF